MKIDEAIEKYIELRDKKAEYRASYNAKVEKLDAALKKLEAAFLRSFEKSGQRSAQGANGGTAFIKERTSDKVVDRQAYLEFLEATGNLDLIESRVNKSALDDFIEENGDLPPGVTRSTELTINVRRSK